MTNTIPYQGNIPPSKKLKQTNILKQQSPCNPSFKGAERTIIKSATDKAIMGVFSQHYGNIGDRVGEKIYKLTEESDIIRKSSRYSYNEEGALSITDKKVGRSLLENIVFPFVTLPLYGASAILKKAQKIPFLQDGAKELYNKPLLRIPRKLNEVDSKTDMLKGMFEKTKQTVDKFAKEKGIEQEELLRVLNTSEKHRRQHPEDAALFDEANEYIKENLYKVSNKFFDKHTGNFNTAYERPLNRLITGAIPIAFLANDAYNLSVLCGDKKEDSEREADERTKQEIIRICTTAYIQLLTFGAFTKQVNTIPWFAPVTSAATVFVSEIFSRHKLGKPVFFLSKDTAQEYNQRLAEKEGQNENTVRNSRVKNPQKSAEIKNKQISSVNKMKHMDNESENNVFKGFNKFSNSSSTAVFGAKKGSKKEEPRKALMNFDTFKKGVIGLTTTFFALNFMKNSTLTKNSVIVQGFKDFGKYLKKNIYDKLAYKDFEITAEKFNEVMKSLKDTGSEKVAEGHEFIKGKYAKQDANGIVKMYQATLNTEGTENVIKNVIETAKRGNSELTEEQTEIIGNAIRTAVRLGNGDIAEKKYGNVANKALEIIRNKKIKINDEQAATIKQSIVDAVNANAKEEAIKIATKIKPFVDIVTEPFKFVYSAARLPFKLVKSGINLIVKPVEKKAAQAAIGKAELSNFESNIHKAVTEIFGEEPGKTSKISQTIFANAMEQLEKKTQPYRNAEQALQAAINAGKSKEEIAKLQKGLDEAKQELMVYVNTSVEKSFNGVTQSSNKNTDLALMSKLASSTVTSAFLVADNYNMVMIKSNGEDTEEAKEKANERIIQRLSGLFYQALFINWFNQTFRSTYNSSLTGMAAVAVPNTITTEVLMRSSIGMPIGRKTIDELNEMDRENENRTGIAGKYFEFMRLLTGKKPLKDRLPKEKQVENNANINIVDAKKIGTSKITNMSTTAKTEKKSTNVLERLSQK